jgi:hypothetical protein
MTLVRQIVEAFGGREAVAGITRSRLNSVRAWDWTGVPFKHFDVLVKIARARGIGWLSAEVLLATRPPRKARPKPLARRRRKPPVPQQYDEAA